MATFKDRLKELRLEKELTLKELGKLLGLSESTISLYESGKREPKTSEDYKKIADFFNVSLDYLLGKSDIRNPEHPNTAEISVPSDYPHKITSRDKMQYFEYVKKINEAFFMNDEVDESDKKAILETMNEIFWMAKAMNKRKKEDK